jgi:DNA repair protein RecO (recombination protein O)
MTRRERLYRLEAIVLRRQDLGEADRLTTVYSQQRGKLRLVAKGVRKPRSRKAGHLEPFTRVALQVAKGRELDLITQAETLEAFPALREDLERIGRGALVLELVDRFVFEEGEENPAIYQLLLRTLERLAAGQQRPEAVLLYFQVRLLELAGFRPDFFHCVACGAGIRPQGQYFSYHLGGVLCPDCGARDGRAVALSLAGLKVLRHYLRSSFEQAVAPSIRPQVFAEVSQLMEAYMRYLLERQLNAPRFLRAVREMPGRQESAL